MKTYIIFVHFKIESVSGRAARYVDSQWASEAHATARKAELHNLLSMSNVVEWDICIKEGLIADAALHPIVKAEGE